MGTGDYTTQPTAQQAESLVDKLQLLGMIPGPQKYYYQFLSGNAGLVTSLADLVNKISNGTATRNDYIDAIKDIGTVGVGVAGLATLATGATLPLSITIGIGLGLATLDYLDSRNYDPSSIAQDVKYIKDGILGLTENAFPDINSKYNDFLNATPEDRAAWIKNGALPWNYSPSRGYADSSRPEMSTPFPTNGFHLSA